MLIHGSARATRFVAIALLVPLFGAPVAIATDPEPNPQDDPRALSSREQGQTSLAEVFEWNHWPERIRSQRRHALSETRISVRFRTFYLDRDKFDTSRSQAWAIGGALGLKTGFFLGRVSVGATGYTSQRLTGKKSEAGTQLLKEIQHSYTVLGEAYADIRIVDELNLFIGRKRFDTPYINGNDARMTPNTFQAAVLIGQRKISEEAGTLSYGAGYFDKIKERNDSDFVSMSKDAGASVKRGVAGIGARWQLGDLSIGAIDYYSEDVINIGYAEAGYTIPLPGDLGLRVNLQYSDQHSTGAEKLMGDFWAHQFGAKLDLPIGPVLLTTGFTTTFGDADMQSPWSGYPGYTSVQVESFNREGEEAFLLRAGVAVPWVEGLSAYALWVHGTDPEGPGRYAVDEFDANLQWAPARGWLKGFSLRLRYALVDRRGAPGNDLHDFRVIVNYAFDFGPLALWFDNS